MNCTSMSATHDRRARESVASSSADPESLIHAPEPRRDDPLQLLRDAIAGLKLSNGDVPNQAEVVGLLAEAREVLEHANVVGLITTQCAAFLANDQFDQAFEALDTGLLAYPEDPALIARRRSVEERQNEIRVAAAVRTAIEETKWLLDQGRPDLAAQFLREKVSEWPDQPALNSRLQEIEELLPKWERDRQVQAALALAADLEKQQQWRAALTILEEALERDHSCVNLIAAKQRVQERLADDERQKKLTRRLEQIRQKIASRDWMPALSLIENVRDEFPGAPGLKTLWDEVQIGRRQSECEATVAAVRQHLADDELELAGQALQKGFESLGPDPVLDTLQAELESCCEYRDELRKAQVLFGKRQLRDAESILMDLVACDRPEAQKLLDAVRQALATGEEESFYEHGRDTARKMIEQEQPAQAVDLLRNLLALFPGDTILQWDLRTAQAAADKRSPAPTPMVATTGAPALPASPQPPTGINPVAARSRVRLAATVGAASLILISAGTLAWNRTGRSAKVSSPPAVPSASQFPAEDSAPAPIPAATLPSQTLPQSLPIERTDAGQTRARNEPESTTVLRPFVKPTGRKTPLQPPVALPSPPALKAIVSVETRSLPAELVRPANAPAPPPQPAPSVPVPEKRSAAPIGGHLQAAQIIERVLPEYPLLARQQGMYGTVELEALVDADGKVKDVRVIRGAAVLGAAAQKAVQKWKYKPALLNGKPVESPVEIQISFRSPDK